MVYRVFGSENSPYSVKWLIRNNETSEEFQKYAKLPLVPLVVTPENKGMQDSTPIMEVLEAQYPEPTIHPLGIHCKFISELLEEFGDEWLNKYMFHYRWFREVDQKEVSKRLAMESTGLTEAESQSIANVIKERMSGRGFTVGSNPKTFETLEQGFSDCISLLEQHLQKRSYIFGERPSFADFGIAPQLYQAYIDPTAGAIMRKLGPKVIAWAKTMCTEPKSYGEYETWGSLCPTLEPILTQQVQMFLAWSDANSKALAAGQKEMTLTLPNGKIWWQTLGGPQKYHAKSLKELRRKYNAVKDNKEITSILESCNLTSFLIDSSSKL